MRRRAPYPGERLPGYAPPLELRVIRDRSRACVLSGLGTRVELNLGMATFDNFVKTWDDVGLQAGVDLDLGPGFFLKAPTFVHPKIEVGTIAGTLRVDGQELITCVGERLLRAHLDGDRFVMSGGCQGDHSIAAHGAITSPERLLAHWRGYCDNQAGGAS
jgi:hypothetical protein